MESVPDRTKKWPYRLVPFMAWSLLALPVFAELSITVDTNSLPVGASTTVKVYLQPSAGPVSGAGVTLLYDPDSLAATFVGIDPTSLGSTQAVHLAYEEPGRMVFSAGRPLLTQYTPSEPELFACVIMQRISGDSTTIAVSNAFTATPGTGVITNLSLTDIIFGFVGNDSDGDGISDIWEYRYFGNLDTAGPLTDFDGDGESDLDEFLNGHYPRIPFLTAPAALDKISQPEQGRVALTFLSEAGVTYQLLFAPNLLPAPWSPGFFSLTADGNLDQQSLVGSGGDVTIYFDPPPGMTYFLHLVPQE